MKASPAFQFYPRDFLADQLVACMTLQERGAYITLLCHCWTEGSIPDDVARIGVLLGLPYRAALKLWPALESCFTKIDGGRLIQKRLEIVRAEQAAHRELQSDKGRRGAEARWAKEHGTGNGTGNAQALHGQWPDDGSASASAATSLRSVASPVRHPRTVDLADAHAAAILAWKPDAKPQTRSAASLRAYDAVLRIDERPFDGAVAVLDWVFRGGHVPRNGFDWRGNVLSGEKLRKHFDRLDAERQQASVPLQRDVRVGQAEARPHAVFTTTGRVDL